MRHIGAQLPWSREQWVGFLKEYLATHVEQTPELQELISHTDRRMLDGLKWDELWPATVTVVQKHSGHERGLLSFSHTPLISSGHGRGDRPPQKGGVRDSIEQRPGWQSAKDLAKQLGISLEEAQKLIDAARSP